MRTAVVLLAVFVTFALAAVVATGWSAIAHTPAPATRSTP